MNFVQPIRDMETIVKILEYLKSTNDRNYILFALGIYSGLRISDILKLKVKDLKGSHISIREKKTKKQKRILIPPFLKRELKQYLNGKPDDEYVIKSRQGGNEPIKRVMAYNILKQIARDFGLSEIGTHTLRKTFGYHFYNQTKNVAMLQDIFNHSDPKVTLRYIGVNQDSIDKVMSKFKYG